MTTGKKDLVDEPGGATLSLVLPAPPTPLASANTVNATANAPIAGPPRELTETISADPPLPAAPKEPAKDAATLSVAGGALPLGLMENENPDLLRDAPMELPPSLQARFVDVLFLGRGGMGAVYRAKDERLSRDVAIKLLFGGGADTTLQMLREARSQARFEHENACKVYEVGVAEGHRYIVMQFIHGEPLDKAKVWMSVETKTAIIRKVAEALHEAHRIGLIHRDIKPSNIMVEQLEDGSYKPYLMDFGLAREVGAEGDGTRTGVVAGTPAFMSPEQALGHVRSLDRRSDVYSLGATLYELLGDRPPFVDSNIFRLLQRVAHEDCAPLRKIAPVIPEDLEIVVAKCLEKEPARRYESAKALGDDLQRYLDGEPISARKNSLAYVMLKKLKRHKGKAILLGVGLSVLLSLGLAWGREQRLAEERERTARELGRELGEDVKEMELFLRNAYSLPLHDIDRERKIVRERLLGIEAKTAAAGAAAQGPGHYALGRGYAALEEYEKARDHLKTARKAGYASRELDYAMGLVLGELYRKALEGIKRIENPEAKQAKLAEIEADLKKPALESLRSALGAKLETPSLVEGLIALYDGRNDEARRLAKEAFAQAPWLYEAKKLEGDADFAEGSLYRNDAAFDYEKMKPLFERAAQAYEDSSSIARSAGGVYEAMCDLWTQMMLSSHAKRDDLMPSFEKAKQACQRGVTANPGAPSPHIKLAFAFQTLVWQQVTWQPGSKELTAWMDDSISRAELARQFGPGESMAHYVAAAAWRSKALFLRDRGLDASYAIAQALDAYRESIDLDPAFLWPLNERCATFALRARLELWKGEDPANSVAEGGKNCRRAMELAPRFIHASVNQAIAQHRLAQYRLERGQSPEPAVQEAIQVLKPVLSQSPNAPGPVCAEGLAYLFQLAYEDKQDEPRETLLPLAERAIENLQRTAKDSPMSRELQGRLALLKAFKAERANGDPKPDLHEAEAAFSGIVNEDPWDMDAVILLSEARISSIRWALRRDEATAGQFDEAFAPLVRLLDQERIIPHFYQSLAEMHALKARFLAKKKQKNVHEEVAKGLMMAEKALTIHPGMALSLLTRGHLWLIEAQQEHAGEKQKAAALKAKEAIGAALKENALLKRDAQRLLDEIAKP